MSDIQHIDIDSDDFDDAPRALREYAKSLKKELEARSKELSEVRGQLTSRAVADVLADRGFKNPKRVERDLLADGIDPLNSEAVESWLNDNGDDYARAGGSENTGSENPAAASEAAAHQTINNVVSEASAAEASTRLEQAFAEITPDMNGEQVAAVYAKYGI